MTQKETMEWKEVITYYTVNGYFDCVDGYVPLEKAINDLLSSQAHTLKEQMIELLDEQVFEGEDECAGKLFLDWDKAKETLSAIESIEI